MPYDVGCFELAKSFLPERIPEGIPEKLAQEIQDHIETFIGYSEYATIIKRCEQEEHDLIMAAMERRRKAGQRA